MNEEKLIEITREYLKMAAQTDEDRAFEWLTALHPEYVDAVLDYLEEFAYNLNDYYRG